MLPLREGKPKPAPCSFSMPFPVDSVAEDETEIFATDGRGTTGKPEGNQTPLATLLRQQLV